MVRTALAQDRKKIMDSLNSLLFIVSTILQGGFSINIQLKGLDPLTRMKADTQLVLSYQFSSKLYSYHIFTNSNLFCSQPHSHEIKYTTSFYHLLKAPHASLSLNTTCHVEPFLSSLKVCCQNTTKLLRALGVACMLLCLAPQTKIFRQIGTKICTIYK